MSSKRCDELWRAAVADLVENLDAEQPEDPAAAPRTLADWARLYIKYLQVLRKLGAVADLAVHPQKRRTVARMLRACVGRLLEIQPWLVRLNGGVDVVPLEAYLPELGLGPEVLEVAVPTCFRDDRAEAIAARNAAIAAARAARPPPEPADPAAAPERAATPATEGAGDVDSEEDATSQSEAEAEGEGEADAGSCGGPVPPGGPPLMPNVEGLSPEGSIAPAPAPTPAAAATRIQAAARGWLARRRVAAAWQEELRFLGMLPLDASRTEELQQRLAAISLERKARRAQRQAEYEEGLAVLKAKLKRAEGYAMRERMQEQLNDWFLRSRDPESGAFPDLPDAAKGGSRRILRPPPPEPTPEEAAALAAAREKEAKAKGKGAKGAGAGAEGPKLGRAFVEELHGAIEEYMDVWQDYQGPADSGVSALPELAGLPQPCGGSTADAFDAELARGEVRPVVEEEVRLEVDEAMRGMIANIKAMLKEARDGKKKGKKGKKGDKGGKKGAGDKKKAGGKGVGKKGDAIKAGAGGDGSASKPAKKKRKDLTAGRSVESIFWELAAQGLVRECPPARLSHYLGGCLLGQGAPLEEEKPRKGKGAAGGAKKAAGGGSAKPAASPGKPKAGKGGAAAAAGAGAAAGTGGSEPVKEYPSLSMAQVRRAAASSCILPLAVRDLPDKVQPHLLYGPPGSGKTLLCHAIASEAGATLFDLSPAATDRKYPGKQAALMVHMVFKAARALAPSVVLLDEAEKVFVSDKARARSFGGAEPFSRIKKQLVAEVADLESGDGVLVLGCSSHPEWCTKKDERALRTFFPQLLELPLPDYSSRQVLLREFGAQEGLDLAAGCSLSLVAQLTAGYSAGQLRQVVMGAASRLRAAGAPPHHPAAGNGGARCAAREGAGGCERAQQAARQPGGARQPPQQQQQQQQQQPSSMEDALLEVLPGIAPMSEAEQRALREWTARAHVPLPPEEPKEKDGKKKKK